MSQSNDPSYLHADVEARIRMICREEILSEQSRRAAKATPSNKPVTFVASPADEVAVLDKITLLRETRLQSVSDTALSMYYSMLKSKCDEMRESGMIPVGRHADRLGAVSTEILRRRGGIQNKA